jgi:RmuC family
MLAMGHAISDGLACGGSPLGPWIAASAAPGVGANLGWALLGLGAGIAAAMAAVRLGFGRGRDRRGDPGESRVAARLEVQSAELRRLADAASARDDAAERVRGELAAARRALEEMNVREHERRAGRAEEAEVIRRLSAVLAGGASRGRPGENMLRQHLSELPPGMLVTDFRVNGRVVEFGLTLPDGRRLPIDSKWPAVAELEALEALDAADAGARDACIRAVERVVVDRAREVAQYLEPSLTAPAAVAAIPDAAYAVLRRAHADAFARGVVIVPYSAALPVALFLYSLVQRFGDVGDARSCLAQVGPLLDAMEGVLENKFARAARMMANGTEELRAQLGAARGSMARAAAGRLAPGDRRRSPPDADGDVLEIVR